MKDQVNAQVRKFISDSFLLQGGSEALSDDASLLDMGLIDSAGVLELVFFIESTFGLQVSDQDMVPANLDSIANIARYIGRKQGAQTTV